MILKYDISPKILEKIPLSDDERLYYSIPYDIDEKGEWIKGAYLFVTTRNIHIFDGETIKETIKIKDLSNAKAEAKVGGGILVVTKDGEDTVLVHYSARHLSRYAYIARGINILISGRFEEVESKEYEKMCPKCGRAIPGTKNCPKCSKEGGFLKEFIGMAKPYKKD
ncbi:MAG: hypothetical protein J6P37_00070, partial [Lachnospiraceae bacterium]|nr:hypothetical protein [Lachnospiraceae bacterium]